MNQFIVIFTEGNFTLDLEHLCVRGLSTYCLLLVGACVYLAKAEESPAFSCLQLPHGDLIAMSCCWMSSSFELPLAVLCMSV